MTLPKRQVSYGSKSELRTEIIPKRYLPVVCSPDMIVHLICQSRHNSKNTSASQHGRKTSRVSCRIGHCWCTGCLICGALAPKVNLLSKGQFSRWNTQGKTYRNGYLQSSPSWLCCILQLLLFIIVSSNCRVSFLNSSI